MFEGLMNDADVIAPVSGCVASTPFIEVLRFFEREKCSSVPIVERDGKMVKKMGKLVCLFFFFFNISPSHKDWSCDQERFKRSCKGRNLVVVEPICR